MTNEADERKVVADFDDDDSSEMEFTPTALYEKLILEESVILTIPAEEEDVLRQALISVKGKANAKLKADGMPVDTSKLEFTYLHCDVEGAVRIQITLAKRKTIKVYNIETPSDF